MTDTEAKPLQAMFDVGDHEAETVEGTGFEPGTAYTFSIDKEPRGQYMQYGKNRTDGLANLYVLSKKTPADLLAQYQKHPAQFEIFTAGEINGMQALVPGADFDKFAAFLTPVIKVGWKCQENNRIVFMDLGDAGNPVVNPGHPEWESVSVRLGRKMNYDVPEPQINGKKNPEKFSWSFLHMGVKIKAEVVMIKARTEGGKENPAIDIDTVELLDSNGEAAEPQKKIGDAEADSEMKDKIKELSAGCKTRSNVINNVRTFIRGLKLAKAEEAAMLGEYSQMIGKMHDQKEILN